jgi:DNA-binding Xre family transcriptional regulator
MSLWSMLAAPQIAGNDLRSVSSEILSVLTNRDVIRCRGLQGSCLELNCHASDVGADVVSEQWNLTSRK